MKIHKPLLWLLLLTVSFSCKAPQALKFTGFQDVDVQPVSFANSNLSFSIGVFNPNPYGIRVKQVDAKIKIAEKEVGTYQLDSLVILPPQGEFVLPVKLVISNGALLSNMLSVLAGDSIGYSLAGKVKAGRKIGMAEIPFSYSGHLSQNDFLKNPGVVK